MYKDETEKEKLWWIFLPEQQKASLYVHCTVPKFKFVSNKLFKSIRKLK